MGIFGLSKKKIDDVTLSAVLETIDEICAAQKQSAAAVAELHYKLAQIDVHKRPLARMVAELNHKIETIAAELSEKKSRIFGPDQTFVVKPLDQDPALLDPFRHPYQVPFRWRCK